MKRHSAALAAGLLAVGACGEGAWVSTPLPADDSQRTVTAPLDCAADLPGTDTELAASPRLDAEAEWIAIALDGTFAARPPSYERIRSDLAAIRERLPIAQRVHARNIGSDLELAVDAATYDAVAAGTYHAWDCLHERYGWSPGAPVPVNAAFSNDRFVTGTVLGRFNRAALTALYQRLPGVGTARLGGAGVDGSLLCTTREADDSLHYVFSEGSGDCSSGCLERTWTHVTSSAAGVLELVGESDGTSVPAWVGTYANRDTGHCL